MTPFDESGMLHPAVDARPSGLTPVVVIGKPRRLRTHIAHPRG